jgi:peptidoglycan glycosyltransferase
VGSPQRIPEVETDFIFAVLGEELGLMGATAILISYLLIVGLGCKIAIRAHSAFETILAVGLTTVIGAQAAIAIAGVLRLSPLTELQIPFLAYGPSSLVSNYIIFGILLKISQTATSIDPYSSSTTNGTRSI